MFYIGPHVSIAKDISLAPVRANELGATGFALFTKNQKVWQAKPIEEKSAEAFREEIKSLGYTSKAILPHAGYLINPATMKEDLREKSLSLMLDEMDRVKTLNLNVLNIHPGAYVEGEREDGIKRTVAFLDEVLSRTDDVMISLENTAGAGTVLGDDLKELEKMIAMSSCPDRLGITIDTAHLFGAGYDVKHEIDKIMDEIFSTFGVEKLMGMHLNDSKAGLGSNKDRHERLGLGEIGLEPFLALMRDDRLDGKPLVLETPDEERWKYEIATLLNYRKSQA